MAQSAAPEHNQNEVGEKIDLPRLEENAGDFERKGLKPGALLAVVRVAPLATADHGFDIVQDAGVLVELPLHRNRRQEAEIEDQDRARRHEPADDDENHDREVQIEAEAPQPIALFGGV